MPFPVPQQVDYSTDDLAILTKYIKDKIEYISAKSKGLREQQLPKWARNYKGEPAEDTKTFPWEGASNLVIQLIGTHCDELLARIMSIYMTNPLFSAKLLGDFDKGEGNEMREIIEEFLVNVAMEPSELDLYRVEETWWSSAIKYGTGVVKFPYELVTEKSYVYIGGGVEAGTKVESRFVDTIKRDSPHPENIPLNLFGIDPKYPTLDNSDFIFHIIKKDRHQLEVMLAHPNIFLKEAIEKIKTQPDTGIVDEFEKAIEGSKKGFIFNNECADIWHIHECWFRYYKGGQFYSLIAYYHTKTDTFMGCIYNPYPENELAFEDTKLAYDDATYYGYGFCEMLESYQQEVSTTRNWKIDNKQFATTGIGRVNKNSKLASIVNIFPGAFIPADEGEVEALQFGAGALQAGVEDEMFTLQQAAARAGVDPASGGSGGGIVNAKRGVYSAQGTSMVMQSQNNRNNLRMSDMKLAHVKLGRKLLNQYATFGIGNKGLMYGDRAVLLKKALEAYKDKKLGLLIRPSTASLNKELEKQNDVLLSSILERLYTGDAQLIQAISTPGSPPELVQYLMETLLAKNALMKSLLRNFGHDNADMLVPVPGFLKEGRNAKIGGNSTGSGSQEVNPGQGQSASVIPIAGGNSGAGIPTGAVR
jgi:hypothetical protein